MALLTTTVGRHAEVREFIHNLKLGNPVVYYGNYGMGKSHLLAREIVPFLQSNNYRAFFSDQIRTDKQNLMDLYASVDGTVSPAMLKTIATESTPDQLIRKIVLRARQLHPNKSFVLVIDNMDRMSAKDVEVILKLYDVMYVCGAFSVQPGRPTPIRVKQFLDMFMRIDVNALNREEMFVLMDDLCRKWSIKVLARDRSMVYNEILNRTYFLTLGVVETLRRQSGTSLTKYSVAGLAVHTGGRREMSMINLIMIIGLIFPLFMRYVWRGTFELDLSYFTAAIGALFMGVRLMLPR